MPADRETLRHRTGSEIRAVGAYFGLIGVACGAWVARLPEIQGRLRIGDGDLGVVLFASALGALVAMPLTNRLVPRVGSRRLAWLSAGAVAVALPLIPFAPTRAALMVVFGAYGAAGGVHGVVVNALAVHLEEVGGRSIMSTMHGLFSLGGVIGAVLAAACIALGVAPVPALIGTAAGLALAHAVAGPFLPATGSDRGPAADSSPRSWFGRRPPLALVVLGGLAFLGLVGEGSMGDWSAIYLKRTPGATATLAGLGYAAYSLGMTMGRFAGDALVGRLGDAPVLRLGAGLAAAGLTAAIVAGRPVPAIVGFALVGLGLANAVPILYRAAARVPGVEPLAGIATASTIGYLGFLAGPPLIGLIAHRATLGGALGVVAGAIGLVTLGGRWVGATRPMPAAPTDLRSRAPTGAAPVDP